MKNKEESSTNNIEQQTKLLLDLNQKLLDAIVGGDWNGYKELCCDDLTCFEPEASNNQVRGLGFHQYFFIDGPKSDAKAHMISPVVKFLGNGTAAVVSYTRLQQSNKANPVISSYQETRIWNFSHSKWKHVHFHKSKL